MSVAAWAAPVAQCHTHGGLRVAGLTRKSKSTSRGLGVQGYLMSVVASQSEPPTILAANTAQHMPKPNVNRGDLAIRVTPCQSMISRISDGDRGVYTWKWMNQSPMAAAVRKLLA